MAAHESGDPQGPGERPVVRSVRALWWAGLATLTLTGGAGGVTLRVPADYPSVLQAVDAASPGDTVLVAPGTWTEREVRYVVVNGILQPLYSTAFLVPGITLKSEAGPENTVLDGGDEPGYLVASVLVTGEGTSTTVVEGLTITGDGDGFVTDHPGRTEVRNCRLIDNGRTGMSALRCTAVLEDTEVAGNHRLWVEPARWALDIRVGARLEMRNCEIYANHRGGMRLYECPSILIEQCYFHDNLDYRAGHVDICPDVQIRQCRFERNTCLTSTGGALAVGYSSGIIEFCADGHHRRSRGPAVL